MKPKQIRVTCRNGGNAERQRQTYTVEQLASLLGVSRAAVYRELRANRIPHFRMGKRYVIPRSAIARWLKSAPFASRTVSERNSF
jgi:excisionase family DNA binding protein